MFVDLVTERRKMERSTVLEIADGRVYTGRQALNNGLIDAVGDMETARQWLADSRDIAKSLPLRPLKIKRDRDSLLERISDLFGITLFSERLRLDGVISLWQPALR
jgi:protease-4